jgi:DNA-binding PadR family transcriptional regulator
MPAGPSMPKPARPCAEAPRGSPERARRRVAGHVLLTHIILVCIIWGRNDAHGRAGPPSTAANAMKTHWFYILLSLSTGDRHGSAIMRDVLELTDGDLRLWPATLYGSLDELREQGWIEEVPPAERPTGASDRKRIYRLTAAGQREVSMETRRLEGVVSTARSRLSEGAR